MGANEYKRVWHNETAKIQQLQDENDKLRSELNTADNEFQSICQSWNYEQTKNKQLQADKEELLNACKFMHDAIGAGDSVLPEDHRRINFIIKSSNKHQDSTQEG